ncbi:unnamed protein product [Cuscuta epithymum]|uniref:Retrotransposon Copia-like N-terminal domain-containing protein n=1 Tax=Cuscuta epithymum TaxID=186058 RepID=A0AAV0DQ94_9ASTE|nr:unnamed protein product [Cuscuta epithymum]
MAGESTHTGGDGHREQPERWKINDPSSLYYLSSSDHPEMMICAVALKGESNYWEWATAMKNAFRAKRKMGFLDGTFERPTNIPRDLEDWLTVNSMAVGWIMTSVDPTLRSNLAYMESVRDLWTDLEARFSVGDAMRVHELKELLRNCKQHGQSVTDYFGQLKTLWEEYDGVRNFPQCKCNGCTCDLKKLFLKHVESEKTHNFLMGLDHETFKTLRSNILGADELPSLTKVYHMVVQEERHQNITKGRNEKPEAVAFATRTTLTSFPTAGGKDERSKCSYCHKPGHDIENCFRRTGIYPEWWQDNPGRGRGAKGRGGTGRGSCGRSGRGVGRGNVQAMHVGECRDDGADKHEVKGGSLHKPGFTDEQWQTLMKWMENCKGNSSEEKLIGPAYEDADWSG